MIGPVEGTVATHEQAYNFVKTPEDELKAASLENPFSDQFDMERAVKLFERFCIVCHGPEGDGQGHLFTSKKYPIQPADYSAERAMSKTDGQLFHNIRAGFGVMGAYGPQVSVEDTWQLVNYIRHLQGDTPEKE
jgi:cytochrome c